MNIEEAKKVLRLAPWDELLNEEDGSAFAVLVDGVPTLATKVHSKDQEDSDYDRDLEVVVEVGGQYFKKTGWSQVGSHCYGEYEPSWSSDLKEVFPREKTLTLYE